jgi:hypothetical protein
VGAARKGGPYDLRHGFRVGDRVLILDIPSDLKDPGYEDDPEMRTAELFRFCLGRKFVIRGFDRYGFIELRVDDDRAVKKRFGLNSIWLEPKFLDMISRAPGRVTRPKNGVGWKKDFLKNELEAERIESANRKARPGGNKGEK